MLPDSLRCSFIVVCALLALSAPPRAHAAESAAMEEARVNGVTIAYEDHGKGEPLLLLHGFGSCAPDWSTFLPAFMPGHRVIVAELRGHGRSGDFKGVFRSGDAASDVIALLDHLRLDRVKAIGISMGGITLLHVATRQPERIEAMVLIGAANYLPEKAREIVSGPLPPPILEEFRKCAPRGESQLEALLTRFKGLGETFDDVNFTAPLLGTIKARTLIVHGDDDVFFPVEIPVDMHRAIPESELWIVPGGGHVPIFDAQQPEFERVALRFLKGTPGEAP